MTVSHQAPPRRDVSKGARVSPSRGFAEWFLGIVGGISTFLGLFILFADADQYVGIGGDMSWRVGDISSAWAYGLLAGGVVLLAIALTMVYFARGGQHRTESTDLTDLVWHAGIFLVVNAFLWAQDIIVGGGLEYAYWTTIPWAIGLVIHAGAYYFGRGRIESRSTG
jgi:hypothetical protein